MMRVLFARSNDAEYEMMQNKCSVEQLMQATVTPSSYYNGTPLQRKAQDCKRLLLNEIHTVFRHARDAAKGKSSPASENRRGADGSGDLTARLVAAIETQVEIAKEKKKITHIEKKMKHIKDTLEKEIS